PRLDAGPRLRRGAVTHSCESESSPVALARSQRKFRGFGECAGVGLPCRRRRGAEGALHTTDVAGDARGRGFMAAPLVQRARGPGLHQQHLVIEIGLIEIHDGLLDVSGSAWCLSAAGAYGCVSLRYLPYGPFRGRL